ncbi:adseverin [Platysternon megacephalum]|uniref:Adenosine deaminase n=1 Tax=Platysternon megacephalum TaxID=55544 RepID=A0A4D9DKC9_9SAUR|nr:adseverin [Platysternon megacephalum]
MRMSTVKELAELHGIVLPAQFQHGTVMTLDDNAARGWFRFQRLYDAARACVRTEADMRRVLREAALDDAAEGSAWLEIQIDPSSYAPHVGGLQPALEIVLDEASSVSSQHEIQVGVVVAASRMRHPMEARTLARLAARYAGTEAGQVVGFGLSNDERRGHTPDFAPAFNIARQAGLTIVPHGGELRGPESVTEILDHLRPHRIGHGVRSVEDPAIVAMVRDRGITLEVCPGSNVGLGVYPGWEHVPVADLLRVGVKIALGADDPLLFGTRLVDQYEMMGRNHRLTPSELALLARHSVEGSSAPPSHVQNMTDRIAQWEHQHAHFRSMQLAGE